MSLEFGQLYSSITNPVVVIKQLLLVAPPEKWMNSEKLKIRLASCILLNLLTLAYIFFICKIRMSFEYELVYQMSEQFSFVMDMLSFYIMVVTHLAVHGETVWKSHKLLEVESKFRKIYETLKEEFDYEMDLQRVKWNSSVFHWVCIVGGVLVLFFDFVELHLALMLAAYSSLVFLMKVDEFLMYSSWFLGIYRDLSMCGLMWHTQWIAVKNEPWEKRKQVLQKLIVFQQIHALVWESLRLLEDYFEWSLVFILLNAFIDIMVTTYWAYLTFSASWISMLYSIGMMLVNILLLGLMTHTCSKCTLQSKSFRSIFLNISTDRSNPYLASCLRKLALQLWHEKFVISAGGFVDINNQTLGSFFFTVVMYMVILVQFRMEM